MQANSLLGSTNEFQAAEEELSEEDQQLKNELDMIVERLTVGYPAMTILI